MGMSADANLFYGYVLPRDCEIPELARGTFLEDRHEVRIGHHGYQHDRAFVEWRDSDVWSYDFDAKPVDLAALQASLPPDVDAKILAFAEEHGLPLPGHREDDDSDWADPATAIGWWLVPGYS